SAGGRVGGLIRRGAHEHANAPHRFGLLRTPDLGPNRHSTANKVDELPPPHSITSSARASTEGGTVRPSVLALLRLITNWTFVAWITGRSAGFSPLRMRATWRPVR